MRRNPSHRIMMFVRRFEYHTYSVSELTFIARFTITDTLLLAEERTHSMANTVVPLSTDLIEKIRQGVGDEAGECTILIILELEKETKLRLLGSHIGEQYNSAIQYMTDGPSIRTRSRALESGMIKGNEFKSSRPFFDQNGTVWIRIKFSGEITEENLRLLRSNPFTAGVHRLINEQIS